MKEFHSVPCEQVSPMPKVWIFGSSFFQLLQNFGGVEITGRFAGNDCEFHMRQ